MRLFHVLWPSVVDDEESMPECNYTPWPPLCPQEAAAPARPLGPGAWHGAPDAGGAAVLTSPAGAGPGTGATAAGQGPSGSGGGLRTIVEFENQETN